MSVAYARPLPQAAPERHPRRIEIVTTRSQRRARPKTAYAVVTIAALFAIFGAQLLLSIVVSNGAYEIDALQAQQKELLRTELALQESLATLDSTQNLATQAAHLGMVPNPAPYTLDLGTGAVFALPGTADPGGCGGSCNLIANSLLTGMALVNPATPAAGTPTSPTAAPVTPSAPTTVDALPAPVTH